MLVTTGLLHSTLSVLAKPLISQLSHTTIHWLSINEVTSRIRYQNCGRRRRDGASRC